MKKTFLNGCIILSVAIAFGLTSCQKEVAEAPATTGEGKPTLIYIRAVDKDSSVVNSEQILLR